MHDYTALVQWHRQPGEAFIDKRYRRVHRWGFDGGVEVPASSSPNVVPLPYSDASCVDPEEAYVAALSSCHMLTFLWLAALDGYVVDRYDDRATGTMTDIGGGREAVTRVLAGKIAGQADGGGIDLIWINGENFAAMKRQDLLFGPILHLLPNMKFVDPLVKPTVLSDFTVPTDGYESPWGMAQLVFFHDSRRVPQPPRSPAALLAIARSNPGRFTYPAPPDFIGSTVLKQFLLSLAADRKPFEIGRASCRERVLRLV